MRFLFQGELTESSKKILRTQQLKTACLAGVSCMLVVSGIVVLVAAYTTWLVLLLLLVPIVLGIIVCCTPFYSVEPPVEVLFEDEMVYITCEKFWRARNYESIKRIYDFGDCYYFIFYFPHKNVYCLCQKDLLREGTLKDFEQSFHDLIQKK